MNLFHPDALMLAFWSPSPTEMMVVAMVALLLYGGKLPEVARSWGKSFAEFRRGLTGFQNELNEVIYSEPEQLPYHEDSEYPPRDDRRLADGYDDIDDSQDDADDEDETASYRPDEFSPGEPPEDEAAPEDVAGETGESDQTVKDVSADTVIIDPEKPKA